MSMRDNLIQGVLGRMNTAIGTPDGATDTDRVRLGKMRLHLAGLIVDDFIAALGSPTDGVIRVIDGAKVLRTSTREQWAMAVEAITNGA